MKRTLLSVKELAQELGISADPVYRAYRKGKVPPAQINRMIRFDEEKVQRAMEKKAQALDRIPLLNILSASDRQRLLQELTETHYGKGAYIFRQGDPTKYFHIVKEGTVKCVKSTPEGKECTLKMLFLGDLFCCDAAGFDGTSHPCSARPMGDVSILRMSKQFYFELLRRSPDAAIEVIKYLGIRLNEAQEKTRDLALDPAEQRLASLLVDLASRNGVTDPNGIRLTIRMTRQDMANMVGITTETAIRIMSRFKRDRLVSGTANCLLIRNLSGLKARASAS